MSTPDQLVALANVSYTVDGITYDIRRGSFDPALGRYRWTVAFAPAEPAERTELAEPAEPTEQRGGAHG